MEEIWVEMETWLTLDKIMVLVRSGLLVIIGYLLAKLAARMLVRVGKSRFSPQQAMIAKRAIFYLLFGVILLAALNPLVDLRVLLGAAGILTVALGFAAQTSVSNLISGLFLLGESAFVVGDIVRVEETTGVVESIDWLSVKLRTFDNLMVRIPNETMLKAKFTNVTRYPIRRIDVQVGVAYKEDTERVREILFEVADRYPLCLDEPKPLFIYLGYGDSALQYQFSVWTARENFLDLKNAIHIEIKRAFDEAGIEIPFPHRSLYSGEATKPFPIRIVEGEIHPAARPD